MIHWVRKNWSLLSCLCFLSTLCPALAQAQEPIRFEFTVFGLHPGDFEGIYYLDPEGEPRELEFRRRHRSPVYPCELPAPQMPMRFFRIQGAGENVRYETVAEIVPNSSWSNILFLFLGKNGNRDSTVLRVYAAADDEQAFPFGSLRVVNLTGIPLGGSIDQQSETIPSGKWTEAFTIRKPGNVDVLFAAATSQSVHLVYRRTMPLGMNSRTLLILRPPARTGSIRIGAATLQDFRSDDPSDES